jgi:hypothetical protein
MTVTRLHEIKPEPRVAFDLLECPPLRSALWPAVKARPLGQALGDACFVALDPSLGLSPGAEAADGCREYAWNPHLDSEGQVLLHDLVGRP